MAHPDVSIRNEGTVWVFNPLTPAAKEWFDENVHTEPYQWLGTSLVVDHGLAAGLVQGILDAGLEVG